MDVRVTLEGLDALRHRIDGALEHLEADLREATLDAAAAGVTEAQRNHTYKDHRDPKKSHRWKGMLGLTDTSHAEQPNVGNLRRGLEAIMSWPAPYAVFVDKGTSRARAYPFTPQADKAARAKLDDSVERALAMFKRAMGG
jgi:hypothetical protein